MKNLAIAFLFVLGLSLVLVASIARAESDSSSEPVSKPVSESVASLVKSLAGLSANEIVERAEDALRGESADITASMTITTPRWTRVVRFHSWDDRRGDRSFIRILSPKKDSGTGFLRLQTTFWTYLPRVERTMRIPPSMMLQSWMGSDFTNDDLARESSMIDDYKPELIGEKSIDGVPAIGVRLIPREDAPVVWARIDLWLQVDPLAPIVYDYYDEPDEGTFEVVRRMRFSDIRKVQGRQMPHEWVIEPLDKKGHSTRMSVESVTLDEFFDDSIFTQRNLRRAEATR